MMGDHFKLCILKSKNDKHMGEIHEILRKCTFSLNQLGPIRRDFNRNKVTRKYSRTNRFITIIHNDVYERLLALELDDTINIAEYEVRSENLPPENSSSHCFFPFSDKNKSDIINKLTYISNMGIFNMNDIYIHDDGIIEFSNNIDLRVRVMVKVIIDTEDCRISWCRNVLFNKVTMHFN